MHKVVPAAVGVPAIGAAAAGARVGFGGASVALDVSDNEMDNFLQQLDEMIELEEQRGADEQQGETGGEESVTKMVTEEPRAMRSLTEVGPVSG